jgi:tripartite ATP-independent transporter DctP family solute receptor
MTLTRRSLFAVAAGTAAAGIPLGQAFAQQPREIKLGYALAQNSHFGAAAQAWSDAVEKSPVNNFKFRHFPSSALGGEREMIEGLTLGTVEAVVVSNGVLSNFVPDAGVMDVPFLFRDTKHARAVLDGKFGEDLLAKFRARGLIALGWGEQGFRHLTNNKRPVAKPEDAKGLKIRVTENQVHIAAFRQLGIAPTPMAWPEVLVALQQGTIDGQENPVSVIVSAKLWQVQKHMTLTGHVYAPMALIVSPTLWASLNEAQKKAFTEGARVGGRASRQFVDDVEKKGVEEIKSHGVQVVGDVDKAAFRSALVPAYKQFAEKFGQKTMDDIAAVQ